MAHYLPSSRVESIERCITISLFKNDLQKASLFYNDPRKYAYKYGLGGDIGYKFMVISLQSLNVFMFMIQCKDTMAFYRI